MAFWVEGTKKSRKDLRRGTGRATVLTQGEKKGHIEKLKGAQVPWVECTHGA